MPLGGGMRHCFRYRYGQNRLKKRHFMCYCPSQCLPQRGLHTSSMAVKVPVAPPKWVGELVRQKACAGERASLSWNRSRTSSWNDSQGSCRQL